MSKERWFQAYERLLDEGHTESQAEEMAWDRAADMEADAIDAARNRAKYDPIDMIQADRRRKER